MRILIVAGGYPTEKYYLNGIFEFDQAQALAKQGHEVIFAAIDLRSVRRWRHWFFESIEKNNVSIEVVNIPLGPVAPIVLHFFGLLGLKYIYRKCLKKFGKPDVIHAHFTDYAYIALQSLKKTKIPIVMTEHSSGINCINIDQKLWRTAEKVYHNVNTVIAVSNELKAKIMQEFSIKALYIPNVVDLKIFSYDSNPNKDSKFRIISVGNLIPRKRMKALISGFASFVKFVPDSELFIYGSGPEKDNLQAQISSLRLSDRIVLKGSCKRDIIANALKTASCFVLVSEVETFGVVLVEAMACGLPVIATKSGGPESFIHSGNGILIPVDDEQSLLDALKKMYLTINDYNRGEISSEVKQLFSAESIVNQLESVYERVIYD